MFNNKSIQDKIESFVFIATFHQFVAAMNLSPGFFKKGHPERIVFSEGSEHWSVLFGDRNPIIDCNNYRYSSNVNIEGVNPSFVGCLDDKCFHEVRKSISNGVHRTQKVASSKLALNYIISETVSTEERGLFVNSSNSLPPVVHEILKSFCLSDSIHALERRICVYRILRNKCFIISRPIFPIEPLWIAVSCDCRLNF